MSSVITAEQVSEILNIGIKAVHHLADQKSIPSKQVDGRPCFYRSDIDYYLKHLADHAYYILVVDDSHAVCEMIRKIFEEAGHIVLAAQNGNKALELIDDVKFDEIFLDLRMPFISGLKILEHIRMVDEKVPVIIITGYADDIQLKEISKYNISQVLEKPFNRRIVIETLSKCR